MDPLAEQRREVQARPDRVVDGLDPEPSIGIEQRVPVEERQGRDLLRPARALRGLPLALLGDLAVFSGRFRDGVELLEEALPLLEAQLLGWSPSGLPTLRRPMGP